MGKIKNVINKMLNLGNINYNSYKDKRSRYLVTGYDLRSTCSDNRLLNTYANTIANEFSKMIIRVEDPEKKLTKKRFEDLNYMLGVRPNSKQTPTDFAHTFFYDVYRYQHGFAIITQENELEIIHPDLYNHCILIDDNLKFHVFVNDEKTILVDYEDLIHIRREPQSIQFNNKYNNTDTRIPQIITSNLDTILEELAANKNIDVVFRFGQDSTGSGTPFNVTRLDPEAKQKRLEEVLQGIQNGALALDSTESVDFNDKDYKKNTVEEIRELENFYYSQQGLNPNIVKGNWKYEEFSSFYSSLLESKLKSFQEELTYKLLTKEEIKKGIKVRILIDKISGASFEEMSTFFEKGIYHGFLNVNDAREYMGRASIDGGDVYYGNLNQREMVNNGKEVKTSEDNT